MSTRTRPRLLPYAQRLADGWATPVAQSEVEQIIKEVYEHVIPHQPPTDEITWVPCPEDVGIVGQWDKNLKWDAGAYGSIRRVLDTLERTGHINLAKGISHGLKSRHVPLFGLLSVVHHDLEAGWLDEHGPGVKALARLAFVGGVKITPDSIIVARRPTHLGVRIARRTRFSGWTDKNTGSAWVYTLENFEGPALHYEGHRCMGGHPDYRVNGARVDPHIIEHPEKITWQMVEQERNQELRRIMTRLAGKNLWDTAPLTRVHSDVDLAGNKRELLRLTLNIRTTNTWAARQQVFQRVHVVCPSTGDEYYLAVPPTVRTCQEGVAWTFGLDADDYAPVKET